MWGSSQNNERGESFLEFINCSNLNICNRGNTPTFTFPSGENFTGWSNVIDVTLCSNSNGFNVTNWVVRDEESLSDHKFITFSTNFQLCNPVGFRNPKNTNWNRFYSTVVSNLSQLRHLSAHTSLSDIECTVSKVEGEFCKAFKVSCRKSNPYKSTLPSYFTTELLNQR